MHEHKFTEQIVNSVLDELKARPKTRPQWVRVRVGEVFHLEEESVRMHYGLLTQGTPLQNIELRLAEIPLEVRCLECGDQGPVEDHHLPTCSSCGSLDVSILRGDRIEIQLAGMD